MSPQKKASPKEKTTSLENPEEIKKSMQWQLMADKGSQNKKAFQLQKIADVSSNSKAIQGMRTSLPLGHTGGLPVLQPKQVGDFEVTFTRGYASWKQGTKNWHINWALGEDNVYHVTDESVNPKVHYFFTLNAGKISDAVAPKGMKGRKGTSKKFSALPSDVNTFITNHIGDLQTE